MLKTIKQAVLGSAQACGVLTMVKNSRWRRERLLILAYHGIAIDDEHRWDPTLFVHRDLFRERLRLIQQAGCTVLPLGEAIERLHRGDLPDASVALTFDDGTHDFYEHAFPILKEFDFPVTLYLTTFYSYYNKPVFNVAVPYLLWKSRHRSLDLLELTGRRATIALADERTRAVVTAELREYADQNKLSAEQKDELMRRLADRLDASYDDLCRKKILHIVTPDEVSELARSGVDVQLHTHRHRTPMDRNLFLRELHDNRRCIQSLTGSVPRHFCYPSGVYKPPFLGWLREAGVTSATTCDSGLATRRSDPLLLPRLVDSATLSAVEFEGWLGGASDMLPQRAAV